MNLPHEITIKGGIDTEPHCIIRGGDGSRKEMRAEPGESADAFMDRVRALAIAEHADTIFFGGLPE
jgi:hypothetical protein